MFLLYLRYVHKIFVIWKGTKEQLVAFMNELNNRHKTINFVYEVPSNEIPLLDIMSYKNIDDKLPATLYRNSTEQQFYRRAKSKNLSLLKNHIAFG